MAASSGWEPGAFEAGSKRSECSSTSALTSSCNAQRDEHATLSRVEPAMEWLPAWPNPRSEFKALNSRNLEQRQRKHGAWTNKMASQQRRTKETDAPCSLTLQAPRAAGWALRFSPAPALPPVPRPPPRLLPPPPNGANGASPEGRVDPPTSSSSTS